MQNKNLESIARDASPGETPAVVRENARLHLENQELKARIKRGIGQNVVLALIFLSFTGAMFWLYPKYRFIPTKDNNAICEVFSIADGNVTIPTVTEYASDAIIDLNTYDYVNFQETINRAASKWLTESGRKSYLKTLDESGNLERVKKGKLILRSTKSGAGQVEEDGLLEGRQHYWLVQVPVMIEFYVGGEEKPNNRQDFLASVTVVQVEPTASNKKGVAIERITLAPYVRR